MRKIYGVRHLTEWHFCVKADHIMVPFHFSGGSMSAFGCMPATYETDNEGLQKILENSPQYKQGRVFLIQTIK